MSREKVTANSIFAAAALLAVLFPFARICGGQTPARPAPNDAPPIEISSELALQLLAAHSRKAVVWVGAAPVKSVKISAAARSLAEAVGGWADEWAATVIVTPNAIFFHAPKTFDHVRPAHSDPLLPRVPAVELLSALPRERLALFPLGAIDTPKSFRAESLEEAAPLARLENANPGFEKNLRELLGAARARARGERQQPNGEKIAYDVRLAEAPAEQLYARLFAETQIYCTAGDRRALLNFPVSLSRYAVNDPLFVSAQDFVKAAVSTASPEAVETLRFSAGEMIRSERFAADNPRGASVVVDSRLEQIPIRLFLPQKDFPVAWATLEAGSGIERRDLGETIFFGAWMDEDRFRVYSFVSRWARAGGGFWNALFTPYVARPRSLSVAEIGWQRLETLLAELRRRQARGEREVATLDLREFAARGRVTFGQAAFLEILYVGKPEANAQPVILGRHSFFLN